MKKIAVIGAGQLGSRHFQALAKIDIESKIFIVDPSSESLIIAKNRFEEIESANKKLIQPYFYNTINEIDPDIDIAVIATNADVRLKVLELLLANKNVTYLILEKVLFQKLSEYDAASELFERKGAKVWVNCSRRMWVFYEMLNEALRNKRILSFNVYGTNWGLASNAIHMIDLLSYLSGKKDYTIDKVSVHGNFYESKRRGFMEFNGTFLGNFGGNLSFSISSFDTGELPLTIEIITENDRYSISEGLLKYLYSSAENNWEFVEVDFSIPFQSQLTNIAVMDILSTTESKLTNYETAKMLHLPLIRSLLETFNKYENEETIVCPIT